MNFLQRILKVKKVEQTENKNQTVVTTRNLTKHMQETRTILVPKCDKKKEGDIKISMFH